MVRAWKSGDSEQARSGADAGSGKELPPPGPTVADPPPEPRRIGKLMLASVVLLGVALVVAPFALVSSGVFDLLGLNPSVPLGGPVASPSSPNDQPSPTPSSSAPAPVTTVTTGAGPAGQAHPQRSSPKSQVPAAVEPVMVTVPAPSYIDNANCDTNSGEDHAGDDDLDYVIGINKTSWLRYDDIAFGPGAANVQVRIASGAAGHGGDIQFRLDSRTAVPFATVPVNNTGGFHSWTTVSAPTRVAPAGTHTLYVTFTGGGSADFLNLHWFAFYAT